MYVGGVSIVHVYSSIITWHVKRARTKKMPSITEEKNNPYAKYRHIINPPKRKRIPTDIIVRIKRLLKKNT